MVYQNPDAKNILGANETNMQIKIIIFSVNGDWTGNDLSTPFSFPNSYKVRLLFCTQSEFHEIVENFNKKNKVGIKISKKSLKVTLGCFHEYYKILKKNSKTNKNTL